MSSTTLMRYATTESQSQLPCAPGASDATARSETRAQTAPDRHIDEHQRGPVHVTATPIYSSTKKVRSIPGF